MRKSINVLFLLYVGLISIMAAAFSLWITPYGAGVNPDSIVYISAAKSILTGSGYSLAGDLITHYPPLYSIFLAVTGLFEKDLNQSARLLNATFFGINAGLVATAVYLGAGRSYLTTTLAVLFYLSSASILMVHSWAWSEPLFITLSLASIILLAKNVTRPSLALFSISAIFLGLALITRYIGLAYLPVALALVFLGGSGQPVSKRVRNTLAWCLLACAPLGLFLLRNTIQAGSAANRSFGFHPLAVPRFFTDFISNTFDFLAPITLPVGIRPALFGLLAVTMIIMLIVLFKWHKTDVNWRSISSVMALACLAIVISYMVFLYISIATFDAATPIIPRILAPIFVILIVGGFSAMWVISQSLKKPVVWRCFVAFVALLILIRTVDAAKSVVAIQTDGLGYTSRAWREFESLAFVRSLAPEVKVYSNGSDVLRFLIEKDSSLIPHKTNSNTLIANDDFDKEVEVMCRDITNNGALFVYFDQVKRWYLPTGAEIKSICSLPVVHDFVDGTVYGVK